MGVIATAILDLFNVFQKRVLRAQVPDWRLVGRWVGYLPRGRFTHDSIAKAAPILGEHALGWVAHYAVGITFATIAVLVWGLDWARHPTFLPALVIGLVSVVAPFFILQPGMGHGIAASRAPNPTQARLRSLMAHTVFGIGLYLAAVFVAALLP
jgi:hypothetical protein